MIVGHSLGINQLDGAQYHGNEDGPKHYNDNDGPKGRSIIALVPPIKPSMRNVRAKSLNISIYLSSIFINAISTDKILFALSDLMMALFNFRNRFIIGSRQPGNLASIILLTRYGSNFWRMQWKISASL